MRRKKIMNPTKHGQLVSTQASEDIKCISDEERKAGYHPNYTCPICCQYYDSNYRFIQRSLHVHSARTLSVTIASIPMRKSGNT